MNAQELVHHTFPWEIAPGVSSHDDADALRPDEAQAVRAA